MRIEVLVSTMNRSDLSIVREMNLQTNSIIINQADYFGYEQKKNNSMEIKMYSFNERGVGLSRNNALMRSTADICLMADDDMVYKDGYEEIVLNAFLNNPSADMIMFNVPIHKKNGETKIKIKRGGRVHFFNALKYGTVNIAFRREIIYKKNISFSLLFGGGARYGSGEDSIFIFNSLKNRLKIYSSTEVIAHIEESESTWFTGFNKKYFFDRGALFRAMTGKTISIIMMIQFLIRKKHLYSGELEPLNAFKEMIKGSKDFVKKASLK